MSEVTQSILFRQKLYQNFKQSGLLSKLKTSLRTNLLEKLQKPGHAQQPIRKDIHKPLYLRDKFLACVVRQYLAKTNKQYSLSILLPESNLDEEDCLNFNELGQIINLNVSQIGEDGERSLLEVLIDEWTKFRAVGISERSTQTDYSQPVSKKLEDIQKHYSKQIDYWKLIPSTKPPQQDTSLAVKEERMKEQFELQKKRIKRDIQLNIKGQLQKRYETQYAFRSKQMQKAHEGRLTELKNREKGILDSLQRKKRDLEERAKKLTDDEMKMIQKYQRKIKQLQIEHNRKIKQLEAKQKEMWKKELQLKAKKRQYEDSIRLVKQKVIEETLS